MPFTSTCPSCGAEQQLRRETRGHKVACPECGARSVARPALRKHRNDLTGMYVLLGVVSLLVLVGGGLVLAFLMRKSPEAQAVTPASTPPAAVTPTAQIGPAPPVPAPVTPPAPANTAIALTTDVLRQQFARDEASAERQYKDKTLEVTGTLSGVVQELPLRALTFGGPQDAVPPVMCELAADQAAAFAQLKPGQKVTVRGILRGRDSSGFIGLSKCQIVK